VTYLAVDGADDAVTAASSNGGTVLMPADDVMKAGRMAFVADPTGAVVGRWQVDQHIGAGADWRECAL
jgi:predicted enzyme related to lactoylglutathione lyase